MDVIFADQQLGHHPEAFIARGRVATNPERAERAGRLLMAAAGAGHHVVAPANHGPAAIAAVHDAGYLEFLHTAHGRWMELPNAGAEVQPNVHPSRRTGNRAAGARALGIVGLAGHYIADTGTPIGPATYHAAYWSAQTALEAAERVRASGSAAYALCRPPGHHAYADLAGGFCFLNNAAIAAQYLRERGAPRVAILDVDVHHGNGTQGIFYGRDDVFYASIHADPTSYYPFYAGYADERGDGAGYGYNLNLPLAHGSGDSEMLAALDNALAAIGRFTPSHIVVSLGLDASEHDPLGALKVTTDGFGAMAKRIASLGLPSVLVQEGGYLSEALGGNLVSFLAGFEAGFKPR
ncbi:MAG: histone deacetylase family protein [Alphaproteobacteria bacterium]|nr:histone deacetylase family protein [Alphaproteobacteria bacterium]